MFEILEILFTCPKDEIYKNAEKIAEDVTSEDIARELIISLFQREDELTQKQKKELQLLAIKIRKKFGIKPLVNLSDIPHRAHRENEREKTIEILTENVTAAILLLQDGEVTCISEIVDDWYRSQGYKIKYVDSRHGYCWTKDDGKTFAIENMDLFEVMEQVTKKLSGRRKLEFPDYKGAPVGLPFNINFTVRIID